MILIFESCQDQTQQPTLILKNVTLGGQDIHGHLYQKKYKNQDDTNIKYSKWNGKEVSTNEELEALLKIDPQCEAIRFTQWRNDTLNKFELSKR